MFHMHELDMSVGSSKKETMNEGYMSKIQTIKVKKVYYGSRFTHKKKIDMTTVNFTADVE